MPPIYTRGRKKEKAMIERRMAVLVLGAVLMAAPAFADADCTYKGTVYSHGSAVCQSDSQYRCDDGQWSGMAIACAEKLPTGAKSCAFNGTAYSPGSASCQSGAQYRCDDGAWVSLAVACTESDQAAARMAPGGRVCMYNGATVATESTICKAGITFRCEDGDWHNLGTTCQ
jgi:hypothetical protein